MSKPPETPEEAAAPAHASQFVLWVLFLVPVVAILLGVYVWCYPHSKVAAAVAVIAGLGFAVMGIVSRELGRQGGRRDHRASFSLGESLVIAAVIFVLVSLGFRSLNPDRGAARRSQCRNNLKQIALALHNYHDDYGCFPPAYVVDDQGRRMHSWRVLILPYLEQRDLYAQYDFDEPWNGPNNSRLATVHVQVFECPEEDYPTPMTSYVAIVGPRAAWPGSRSTSFDDITDNTAHTLLVVEMANSGIHWMEPRDLEFAEMAMEVNPEQGGAISSRHYVEKVTGRYRTGANTVAVDGSAHYLSNDVSAEQLQALITIDGGESVTFDDLPTADH